MVWYTRDEMMLKWKNKTVLIKDDLNNAKLIFLNDIINVFTHELKYPGKCWSVTVSHANHEKVEFLCLTEDRAKKIVDYIVDLYNKENR